MAAPGAIDLPVSERQRTLIDFEEMLARYVVSLPETRVPGVAAAPRSAQID